jgi:hypothetical protein
MEIRIVVRVMGMSIRFDESPFHYFATQLEWIPVLDVIQGIKDVMFSQRHNGEKCIFIQHCFAGALLSAGSCWAAYPYSLRLVPVVQVD